MKFFWMKMLFSNGFLKNLKLLFGYQHITGMPNSDWAKKQKKWKVLTFYDLLRPFPSNFSTIFLNVFQIDCIKIYSPWCQMCQLQISSYYWYEIPMFAMFKLRLMPALFLLWFYQSKSQTFSSYARILLQKFKKRSY